MSLNWLENCTYDGENKVSNFINLNPDEKDAIVMNIHPKANNNFTF